jgi:hypothetical protein
VDLKYTVLTAPISGRIDRTFVSKGNLLTGGQTSGTLLTKIVNEQPMYVYFDIDALQVISPYNVGADAVFWGLNNKDGQLAIIMCHNNDVGTFWGDIDLANRPLKPSIESLRLGIDFALFALTH